MRIAVFCWRPYHVFSAINMVSNNIENTAGHTTLFLYDSSDVANLKKRLKKTGLFNEVVIVKDYKPHAQYMKKIFGLLFSKTALKRHVEKRYRYACHKLGVNPFKFDKLITTSCNVVFFEFVHANRQAPVVLFEDGTLAYVSDEIEHGMNTHLKRIKPLLKLITRKTRVVSKYVYEPRLVISTGYPLRKLPVISDAVDKTQRRVFSYDTQSNQMIYSGKKIIYLDERYPNDYFKNDMSESVVFDLLMKYKDETVLRPHPGNKPGTSVFTVDTSMQSWELTCRDVLSDDSILITKTSTAAFTPFLLYGLNPHVIYLVDLLFQKSEGEEQIVNGFMNELNYNKMYMPSSLDEFRLLLEKLH